MLRQTHRPQTLAFLRLLQGPPAARNPLRDLLLACVTLPLAEPPCQPPPIRRSPNPPTALPCCRALASTPRTSLRSRQDLRGCRWWRRSCRNRLLLLLLSLLRQLLLPQTPTGIWETGTSDSRR